MTTNSIAPADEPVAVPEPPEPTGFRARIRALADLEITPKKVKRREVMHFTRQLAVFARAGIPLLEAMATITSEVDDKLFRRALEDVQDRLRNGATLAEACEAHPEAFPELYISILRTAEYTGQLDEALERISQYIERDLEAGRKIKEALFYPVVVLMLSIVVVIVLTGWVIPKFETFFKSFHARLPWPTRVLLDVAHFFTTWWWVIGIVIVAMIAGLIAMSRSQGGREMWDKVLLRIPVVGDLIHHAILERFCRILSAMVVSGVPLPDALVVTTAATHNAVFKRGLAQAREGMLRGEGLAGPMAESQLFPATARQMFRVGESTGTLDTQLEVAATYFDRELNYKLSRFTSLFEPAVILVAGVIVGFVAIALISAMYGIYRQVHLS